MDLKPYGLLAHGLIANGGRTPARFSELETCIASPATENKLQAQIAAASKANIRGTPGFLVNARLLPEVPVLPMLEKIYKSVD